jgi:hypothetical protein
LLGLLDVCDFLLLSCMIYELLVLNYTIASQRKAAVSQRFFLIYSLSFESTAPLSIRRRLSIFVPERSIVRRAFQDCFVAER